MIKVTKEAMAEICHKLFIDEKELSFFMNCLNTEAELKNNLIENII